MLLFFNLYISIQGSFTERPPFCLQDRPVTAYTFTPVSVTYALLKGPTVLLMREGHATSALPLFLFVMQH